MSHLPVPHDLLLGALVGFAIGVLLQKGRFCFVSAFRDLFAYKDSRVLRGVVAGLGVLSLGVAVALFLGAPREHLWVPSFGLHSIIGGFIFGVGMTFAGGCMTGTMFRAGEGYIHYWIVLLFTGIGYAAFATLFPSFFLPYYFRPLQVFEGYSPFMNDPEVALAWGIGLGGLFALIIFGGALRRLRRKPLVSDGGELTHPRLFRAAPETSLISRLRMPWDARVCGAGIGALALLWFIYFTSFSVTGSQTRWVGYLLALPIGQETLLENPYWGSVLFSTTGIVITADMLMVAFLILGSMAAALWSGDFKIRRPLKHRLPNAIGGGLLMGFGARMTPGCNISNAFSGLAILSLHSLVATVGLLTGVYVATHWIFRKVGCAL
jgi:uncharacterized membrane protein YedE/YeeE